MKKGIALDDLLDGAVEVARAAGRHALRNRHRRGETDAVHAHDVKLVLDRECQRRAAAVVARRYPAHGILGEEGSRASRSPYRWVIDPIDGTVNFHHGLPQWCTSVALEYRGAAVVGVVYAPELDDLYTAVQERPALCNGAAIKPAETRSLSQALICTGHSKDIEADPNGFRRMETLCRNARKVRMMGAAALDICHVARGRVDGYFETRIYHWDIAAAQLIARQAGAQTEVLARFGGECLQFMAATPPVFPALRALMDPFGS
ncbi:MAG: inositol monophosphatase [Candidatus Marinimicrobia bacterium]|nr:inositol monophosphatase [Candidatus Neomarinimicrobiota bacterium]